MSQSSKELKLHCQVVDYLSDVYKKVYVCCNSYYKRCRSQNYILPLIVRKYENHKSEYYDQSGLYGSANLEQIRKLSATEELNNIAKESGILFNHFMSNLFDDDLPDPKDAIDLKPLFEYMVKCEITRDLRLEDVERKDFKELFLFLMGKLLHCDRESVRHYWPTRFIKPGTLEKKINKLLESEEEKLNPKIPGPIIRYEHVFVKD